MQSVNNCLNMNSDANEIALDKIKTVLIMFEKKKRNLDKRKTKLEDYKQKKDLNEDQQLAVSKYPEVVSMLELLEEFTNQTNIQFKEAEKVVKKIKKQEKLEKKRTENNVIEFALRNFMLLERICDYEQVQQKLLAERILERNELDMLRNLEAIKEKDVKKLTEMLLNMYENNPGNDLLGILQRVELKCDKWLLQSDFLSYCVNPISDEDEEEEEEMHVISEQVQHHQDEDQTPAPAMYDEPSGDNAVLQHEEIKQDLDQQHKSKNFVFLHESLVEKQQMKNNSSTSSAAWHQVDEEHLGFNDHNNHSPSPHNQHQKVNDVFSSATQSEFMNQQQQLQHEQSQYNSSTGGTTPFDQMVHSNHDQPHRMNWANPHVQRHQYGNTGNSQRGNNGWTGNNKPINANWSNSRPSSNYSNTNNHNNRGGNFSRGGGGGPMNSSRNTRPSRGGGPQHSNRRFQSEAISAAQ